MDADVAAALPQLHRRAEGAVKPAAMPRRANLRLALALGAFALLCYFGIYAFYLVRP